MARAFEFAGTSRFQILARVGTGGMGVVYEAFDRERNVTVALKTLKDWNAESLLRFKNEFRALQDLRHRNLVGLGELIEEHGQWFFTMELVRGCDFITWVRPRALSAAASDPGSMAETVRVSTPSSDATATPRFDEARLRSGLTQLAQGLTVLHAAAKVHRDVKPSNILVAEDGRIVLLDFGVTISAERDRFATEDSMVVGTALYMAPEQAASTPVGPEADWYSVGVILYQALTGVLPFDGTGIEVMMAKQREQPIPPRARVPSAPSDLDELCVRLLSINPAARPGGDEILRLLDRKRPAALARSPASFLQAPAFVGRDRERALLEEAFAGVRKRGATAVCVQGESGVGKSALVRHFVESLIEKDDGVVALTGRCYERESVPYKAFDSVIDALSRQMNRMQQPAAIVPRMASLLAQAFPVLLRVEAIAQAPRLEHGILDPQELRSRVFGAMRELLTRLGDRHPLLLVIDDLQWADADSLALLTDIFRPPDAPNLLLLATMRTENEQILKSLPADVQRIRLDPLPPDEARVLASQLIERFHRHSVASAAGNRSVSPETIAEEAGGHPLFIDELVRHALEREQASGPVRLDEALLARIGRLDVEPRQILEVLAVAGTPLTQATVARAAGTSAASFTTHLIDLRIAHLVRTTGAHLDDTVELYHDRVREAIAARLPDTERRGWHERLAIAIEASEKPDPEALALHWQGAGNNLKASTYAVKAAERAADALAFDRAARLYELALRLRPPEGEVARNLRVKMGNALAAAGRGKEAAAAYLGAVEGATAAEAFDLRRLAAQQLLVTGHIEEGLDTIQSVLAVVGLAYPATPRRALLTVLYHRALLKLRGRRFRKRDESSVPARELARIDVCWHAGMTLAVADHMRGHAFHIQGLRLALRAGEPYRLARALGLEIGYQSTAGGRATRKVERMLAVVDSLQRELRHPHVTGFTIGVTGQVHFLSGRFSRALELSEQAQQLFRERCVGVPWEINTMRLWAARSLLYLGRLAELARRLPIELQECRGRGDLYGDTSLRSAVYPYICLAADEPVRAKQEIESALEQWSPRGFHLQHYYAGLASVSAELYQDNPAAALEECERIWRDCDRTLLLRIQFTRITISDLRGRAALACAHAGAERTQELLRRAERDARRIAAERMPWGNPLAALLRAGVAAARRDTDQAVAQLRLALEGAEQTELALHAAVARRRLGELLTGSEGRALIEAADTWMIREGIKNPGRMTALYAPGFDDS